MTVFRIHVHTGRHIELDSKDGIRASEAIQQVLSQSSEDFGSGLTEQDGGHGGKYYLRVRKMVEEGRWWSEDDIKAYRDRMYPTLCFIKYISS
jgi:hypothetical protein